MRFVPGRHPCNNTLVIQLAASLLTSLTVPIVPGIVGVVPLDGPVTHNVLVDRDQGGGLHHGLVLHVLVLGVLRLSLV